MWILGLDLAWTGTTGWAIFDTETENFVDWGDFKPKKDCSIRTVYEYVSQIEIFAGRALYDLRQMGFEQV